MSRIMGIYKITNKITNKVYIGQSVSIYDRQFAHRSIGKNPIQYNHKNQMYDDMFAFGLNNFTFEIIEQLSFSQLNEREKFWITYYDSYNNGYNLTRGGTGHKYDYDEIYELWLQKIPASQIAKIFHTSSSTINTILDSLGVTTEEKYQQSANMIEYSHAQYRKKVYQKDINTLETIQIFNSVAEAANFLKVTRATFREGIKNHNGFYKNYYWEIDDSSAEQIRDFNKKTVLQLDKNTEDIITIFDSVSAAAKAVNSSTSNISKACKNPNYTVKGYKWKYNL